METVFDKKRELQDRIGDIEELKERLPYELVTMNSRDAEMLMGHYRVEFMRLQRMKEEYGEEIVQPYCVFFLHGMTMLYRKFERVIIKAKLHQFFDFYKNIPDAMMYFYNASSYQEALKKEKEYENYVIKKIGDEGEKEVRYALKWLDPSYIIIEGKLDTRYNKQIIRLYNKNFIDEAQEYDHIIIGEQGVFLIETKNYSGEITVDSMGNWIRGGSDEAIKGERNPLQQVRRHEKVLRSIINVPIISLICLANPQAIIRGGENSKVPIIKSDLLVEYIESYRSDIVLTEEEKLKCKQTIEKYML